VESMARRIGHRNEDEDARGVRALTTSVFAMSPHVDSEASSPSGRSAQDDRAAEAAPTPPASTPSPACALNAAPTLTEITQLTSDELSTAQVDDSIIDCGRAALALLHSNPDLARKLAYQKLHDVPYKEVKTCWRRLYTDASLQKVLAVTAKNLGTSQQAHTGAWLDEVVRLLDMALILTAAPGREELVELWFAALEEELSTCEPADAIQEHLERPAKKQKREHATSIPPTFHTTLIEPSPILQHFIPRVDSPSLSAFQKKLSNPATHTPVIITNAIQHWPALSDRPWNSPSYLLERTLGGRRLVPIETGRSYTDSGWGQKITSFRDFMSRYMLCPSGAQHKDSALKDTGYLAQHDVFAQIPSLRADISIPDYCFATPHRHLPANIDPNSTQKLEDPLLNAWFGPKGTISPLHTDPYHNVLAQVVGYKYVRCYKPEVTERMYPRGKEEGVDMGNTSLVDLDEAMRLFPEIGIKGLGMKDEAGGEANEVADEAGQELDQRRREFNSLFPGFKEADYVEAVLGPGECLYLPPGWWHYVKSLSPSFSVSFWFN
jgi:hypothetical protein